MKRLAAAAGLVFAACSSPGPTFVSTAPLPASPSPVASPTPSPSPAPPHITDFKWRNATPTLACDNPLTGIDAAGITCSASAEVPVRLTVRDLFGDCRARLRYGSRCMSADGVGRADATWEAPWDFGAMGTAMTVTVTCEVLDAGGAVLDTRTTCIPSGAYSDGRVIAPPWSDDCQQQILGCHRAP